MKPIALGWPRRPWTWLLAGCAGLLAVALNAGPLRAAWRDNRAYLRLDALLVTSSRAVTLQLIVTPPDWDLGASGRFVATYGLGLTELSLHQYAPALSAFQAALQVNPQYSGTHALLADAYHGAGDDEHAVAEWRTAQAEELLIGRGDLAGKAGDWTTAASWYRLATRVDPQSAPAFEALGQAYASAGETQASLAALEQAVSLAPNDVSMLHALGLAYLRSGALDSAAAAFERVLRLQPNEFYTNYYMVTIELSLGQLDAAQTYGNKATQLAPNDPRAHFALGSVYARQAQWPAAITELKTAISLIPRWNPTSATPLTAGNQAAYHLLLAQAYQSSSQTAPAIAEYQIVLSLDPQNNAAKTALKALAPTSHP